jgi:hypothetical protein
MTEGVTPAGRPSTASLSARIVIFAVTAAIASLSWPLVIARWLLGLAVNRPFAVVASVDMARFLLPMVAMSAVLLGVNRRGNDVWWWVRLGCWIGVVAGTLLLATAEYFQKGESLRTFFGVLMGGIPWVVLPAATVGGLLGTTLGALFMAVVDKSVSRGRFLGWVGLSAGGHVMAALLFSRVLAVQWP